MPTAPPSAFVPPHVASLDVYQPGKPIEDVERALRTGGLAAAVRRFHDILIAHLDREEELVMPVVLALAPREAWDLIHGVG